MAGSRDIKAGKAAVEIVAETDPLKRSLAKGAAMLRSWGSGLASIGSILSGLGAAAAVGSVVKAFADVGSELNDMSMRTGLAGSKLQELGFAAKQSGASIGDIEKALKMMAKNGFSVSQFEQIGQQIAAIQDPSKRAAKALEVFGKSGTALIPMFSELNQLKAASQALGPLLTDEEIRRADELGDAFGSLKESISRAMQQVGASFGPQLKGLLDTAIGMVVSFANAFKDMNASGRGGDWLDKAAEFLRTPFSTFAARGGTAAGASRSIGATDLELEHEAAAERGKTAKSWDDITRSVLQAHEARNALIREFETPAERFLRRQKEISDAIKAVNNNRLLGFVGEGESQAQRKGLDTALFRLRMEEMKRLQGLIPKIEQASRATIATSSRGTFSSAGAALLGRGGNAIDKKIDETNRILRNVEKNTANFSKPKFS